MALVVWLAGQPPPSAAVVQLHDAAVLASNALVLPPPGRAWEPATLPASRRGGARDPPRVAWFRIQFDVAVQPPAFWAILLPYLYGGGQVWLDGELLADVPVATADVHVRWERPFLITVPSRLLTLGPHALAIRASPVAGETSLNVPAPRIGPGVTLLRQYDTRHFWVQTMPRLTVGGCLVVAALVLLIWWRLPEEVLYGWFGVATAMWGIRTLTFVMESVPSDRWPWWRIVYLASTGGFVVVLALFASRLARVHGRLTEYGLVAYWAVGPAWLLLTGAAGDALVNRIWTAGLIPIAVGTVLVSFHTVWRERTVASLWLPASLAVALVAGVHDYLVVWKPEVLARLAPGWAGERYFLLHYAADLVLVAMGGLLSARFVRSVTALRELNETLEVRIAERERALADNFQRLAELERQNAASAERNLIMREIHDGLGSKLFTSLSRVERGAMDAPQMAHTLRACISDMRLALASLAPNDHDLLTAFGDFMFRWQAELHAASIGCDWLADVPGDTLDMPPHTMLQVLRVAQEALTNVVKHARATQVTLRLSERAGQVVLRVADNGIGMAAASVGGRGLRNMQARAQQLGATLTVARAEEGGTVLTLTLALLESSGG